MKLRIGTRKSPLAQVQTQWVVGQLKDKFPDLDVEITLLTTSGDAPEPRGIGASGTPSPTPRRPGAPMPTSGGLKALFTKEIEEALLDNRIDMAVHSLKDMAAELPPGLVIGAVPLREDPHDVWISRHHTPFKDIPKGAKIGTGAVRRQAQLRHLRPDLNLLPLRGNVETRLRKLAEKEFDGIILALAGLKRLGKEKSITEVLPVHIMLPAVGQGALGIEVREKSEALAPYLTALNHPSSHSAVLSERALLKTLGGNCQTPIAAFAEVHRNQITLQALVVSPSGKDLFRNEASDRVEEAETLGRALAKTLLIAGADKILKNVG